MADRFPIIIESTEQQIQELSAGDGLDLTKSGVVNANYVHSAGVNAGVVTATSFIGDGSQITNIPAGGGSLEATASGTLADGSKVIVNADGTVSAIVQTGSGWIATLNGSSTEENVVQGIAIDSSGNIIATGYTQSAGQGSSDLLIVKYNSSGVIQWQRTLGGTGSEEGTVVVTDSSDNIYITAHNPVNSRDLLIAKFNSSGSLQWQKILGGSAQDLGRGIAIDSSSNLYVCGDTQSTGAGSVDMLIAKYNSSGSLQWQRSFGGSSVERGYAVATDSSNNVYALGLSYTAVSGGADLLLIKYNSSGTFQWQRYLGGSTDDEGMGITIDSSDNIYVTGLANTGGYQILIAKYDTSGSIQWQRTLSGSGTDVGLDITTDSSGNVYVTGYITDSGYFSLLIAKYNSSGTIQWQRTFGSSSANDRGNAIVHDGSGNVYVGGYTKTGSAGDNDLLLAKLPDDGSETGTYGNFTYAASSLTDAASTLLSSNGSLSSSTSSLTDSTSSLTSATSNITSSITSMQSSNLTAENFIGISDGSYTNGQTATIQIAGSVDDAQSSLTPGQQYYVQNDGTLSETADTPSVLAGTAVAATKLMIG